MNTKGSKGIIGITLAIIMIASIFAAIAPTPVVANPDVITVDGDGSDWDAAWFLASDPDDAWTPINGYDLLGIWQYYEGGAVDKLYFRLDTDGIGGDSDGDGNPTTVNDGIHDQTNVGTKEEYTIFIDTDADPTTGTTAPDLTPGFDLVLSYNANTVTDSWFGIAKPAGFVASATIMTTPPYSHVVEFSMNKVSNFMDPNHYGVYGYAGSTMDVNPEDYLEAAIYIEKPEFDFDLEYICCRNFEFTGTSSYVESPIVDFKWDYGDGETFPITGYQSGIPENYNPRQHQYADAYAGSSVWVTLSGHNDMGQYGEHKESVYIPKDPTVVANADKLVVESGAGEEVTFMCAGSHVDPSAPAGYGLTPSYHWEFDDAETGDNDDGCDTTRVVDGPDGYEVCGKLTVNDTHCEANATVCVRVREVSECKLRVYGFLDEGAGDYGVEDELTGLHPENPPYTYDGMAALFPQHEQAPRKDFITFDPIIMDHNDGDWPYDKHISNDYGDASEKIFKRMWYEPTEWYKDEDRDGRLDLVFVKGDDVVGWVDDFGDMHELIEDGYTMRLFNDNEKLGDIYAPSIKQEFTYMMLDYEGWPEPAFAPTGGGSTMLIPMASWVPDNGLDSFDADGRDGIPQGDWDHVVIESEASLGIDIDNDGDFETLSDDEEELTGDETLVLTTEAITLALDDLQYGNTIQFFDNKIVLKDVFGEDPVVGPEAKFRVYYQGETSPPGKLMEREVSMAANTVRFFYKGQDNTGKDPQGPFFVQIIGSPDATKDKVTVKVGRMFGNTWANVGANPYWNQKHFYVDSVCYNVVAIKTDGNESFKYVTFREKLPKIGIKINQHTQWLKGWAPKETLPEMPQYNMDHKILQDVQKVWGAEEPEDITIGYKSGAETVMPVPPLVVEYNEEKTEPRFHGELKELYYEDYNENSEHWMIEWFQTLPWEYTLFRLPPEEEGGIYLLTSAFRAPEALNIFWDGEPGERYYPDYEDRLKFWYKDCSGPLFVDWNNGSLRLYGYLNYGAGNPYAGYDGPYPENPAYTDPMAPFLPQADEAPDKDFVTFNPILMYHNDDDWDNDDVPDEVYATSIRNDYVDASEKIFKRMWYEPTEWFKDEGRFGRDAEDYGELDLVVLDPNGNYAGTITPEDLDEEWYLEMHFNGYTIRTSNDEEKEGDIYAPAIKQEFTYMMLDYEGCPEPAFAPTGGGSSMLIPMATWESGDGIDSFDADGFGGTIPEGTPDRVIIESENSLGFDIDGDGIENLSDDYTELSGDETLVLTLDAKTLSLSDAVPLYPDTLQFFDHKIQLVEVMGTQAYFDVYWQGPASPQGRLYEDNLPIGIGERKFFYKGQDNTAQDIWGPFFVEVTNIDTGENKVTVKVGRMFGNTRANVGYMDIEMGAPEWSSQKHFYVDGVCYNVVAIKTDDQENFKYITFRQKLPKVPIKIEQHTIDLKGWGKGMILPELPQFNMNHTILKDIQTDWTIPKSVCDKLGEPMDAEALEITYNTETIEPRFHGELREIYYEEEEYEGWMVEWYQTIPYQYTGFELPTGHGLYLVTSAFEAPESVYHFWDGGEPIGPQEIDSRLKYWFDPADMKDIYVNKPPKPVELEIWEFYDLGAYGGDGDGKVDMFEIMNAYKDYIWNMGEGRYPFGPEAIYTDCDLGNMIRVYLGYDPLPCP